MGKYIMHVNKYRVVSNLTLANATDSEGDGCEGSRTLGGGFGSGHVRER